MNNCEKFEKYTFDRNCPARVYEDIEINVPVNVRAFADVGSVTCDCDDGPRIIINPGFTPTAGGSCGSCRPSSNFTISQKLKVEIPIRFVADVDVGECGAEYDVYAEESGCN